MGANGRMDGSFRVKPIDLFLEPSIDAAKNAALDTAQDIADMKVGPGDYLYDNFTPSEEDLIVRAFEQALENSLGN